MNRRLGEEESVEIVSPWNLEVDVRSAAMRKKEPLFSREAEGAPMLLVVVVLQLQEGS